MPGLFESLGSIVERARGFFSGIFGQAAREEIAFPTISEALEAGGLELEIPELSEDFLIQERQAELSDRILRIESDMLIPGDMHLETDRLLPHKFAYEVEVTTILEDGTSKTHPYYVGSDTRLTPQEILDTADENVEQSPEGGVVGYSLGGITASWVCTEY
jgi:hypothetical protein